MHAEDQRICFSTTLLVYKIASTTGVGVDPTLRSLQYILSTTGLCYWFVIQFGSLLENLRRDEQQTGIITERYGFPERKLQVRTIQQENGLLITFVATIIEIIHTD